MDMFRKHGSHGSQMAVSFTKCEHTRISEEKLAVPSVSVSGYKIMLATKKHTGAGETIANVITREGLILLPMGYARSLEVGVPEWTQPE